MGLRYAPSLTSHLTVASSVITTYPFSVGAWFQPLDVAGTYTVFSISDITTDNTFLSIRQSVATLVISAAAGGPANNATISNALTSGEWSYFVGRFISATNRKLAIWTPTQSTVIQHATTGTSRNPAGLDSVSWGVRWSALPGEYLNGTLAGCWWTDSDIQADGAQLQDAMLLRLAKFGPLGIPHIRNNLIEYWPRNPIGGRRNSFPDMDYYSGRFGRQAWLTTNGAPWGFASAPWMVHHNRVPPRDARIVVPI